MKIKFLFLLIIISFNSFAQFFENDLDYLVYDKQDSLIKKNNVKSLRIISKGDREGIWLNDKFFNKEGNLVSEVLDKREWPGHEELTKKMLDDLNRNYTNVKYSYDGRGNLIYEKREIYEYDGKHKIKKILSAINKSKVVNTRNKVSEVVVTYSFDYLNRLKTKDRSSIYGCDYLKSNSNKCSRKSLRRESYDYANDSLILYNGLISFSRDSSTFLKKVLKRIFKNEFSEIIQEVDSLGEPNGDLEKNYFNTTNLNFIQEIWKKGELNEFKKYTMVEGGLILKKESLQKIFLVSKESGRKKRIQKGYIIYKYDKENRLIFLEDWKYFGKKEKKIFSYYPNGLLKKIETKKENSFFFNQKEYTYEFYENEIKK